ncbi:Multipolar spindle 1, putative isoform 4 [Theobroma cacao]|uniref:Multipolar spindle 1, putative isoform 4 n=1 Tax=Theobroma cacao TaxID=3641 RepID=A0A061GPL4_THECC|nr:Multipolar spindle 1, putative isoform 4 [Theobroma cacao]
MSAGENRAASAAATDTSNDESLRLAVAISLLRSKFLQRHPPPSQSDALKWKRKAKERKQAILRLRDDLKEAEDASQCDLFPQTASCKCYFFDKMGKLSPNRLGDASDRRFNDVLRRRFLRQVRLRERRKRAASSLKGRVLGCNDEDQAEQLKASIDFLVELCDTSSPVQESKFENWSHQAVEFILVALKNLLSTIQLIEFLVSDYLLTWSTNEGFDNILFEEWVTSLVQARKAVEVLESRNGLYVVYIDRVTGELAKLVGQVPLLQKLNSDIFDALFR